MRSALETTRLHMAEHSYPTPSRNHLSNRNADAAKACHVTNGTRTVATRVRHGIRLPDGTIVYRTRSDAQMTARDEELANLEFDRRERAKRLAEMVNKSRAEIDTWASKS